MRLFPAIDILDGKAVRLYLGRRDSAVIYGEPDEFAKKWEDAGASILHIVDLNAAFDGVYKNDGIIQKIRAAVNIPFQLGGGFRSLDRIKYCLETLGAGRVIIGSAAVTDPKLFSDAAKRYTDRIVCGIDEKNGRVSVKGWTEEVPLTPLKLCRKIKASGAADIVYTDISRDGALSGANVLKTAELQKNTKLNVIASGGVASVDDIKALKAAGIYGAILGKALYEGALDLRDALKASI